VTAAQPQDAGRNVAIVLPLVQAVNDDRPVGNNSNFTAPES
jgi:hypothetical protein